jgi:alcohol dehydrogenase class IV
MPQQRSTLPELFRLVVHHTVIQPNSVIAIVGGSVFDAGKADLCTLLPLMRATEISEVIGHKKHSGNESSFRCTSTHFGTGSEEVPNAVFVTGKTGLKRPQT